MVFSSYLFIFIFLPLALLFYFAVPLRIKNLCLVFLSYFFYGWANPLFTVIMAGSTLVDYGCGRALGKKQGAGSRRFFLTISVVTNLSLLGFFKYFNFAYENFQLLFELLGISTHTGSGMLRVTLPLGISFYTFQSMSYTIDVYRRQAKAINSLVDFACYVSLFPQLVAGPIIRFTEVAEQLKHRDHSIAKFARGVSFFAIGMSKKVLLANPCGAIADTVFDTGSRSLLQAWYGVTAYAFQIYYDFSGYSEMAIGLGLLLGFVFPKNFDAPYRSASITEFWHRWHISLSSWLRDYLYIPLGGNRKGLNRTYVNLMVVMLLGGLWHGAAWTFLVWGGLHGLMLSLERLMGKRALYYSLPRGFQVIATFLLILVTWVFFRSKNMQHALAYLKDMFAFGDARTSAALMDGTLYTPYFLGTFVVAAVVSWSFPIAWTWTERITPLKAVVVIGMLWLSIVVMVTQAYNPFIYFIF